MFSMEWRVSWRDIDYAELAAGNRVFDYIPAQDMAKPDHRIPFQDDKLFHLGIMIMVAPRDSRPGARYKNLSDVGRFHQLSQFTPEIDPLGQCISEGIRWKIGNIGRIEGADKRVAHVRQGKADPAVPKALDRFRQGAQRYSIRSAPP